MKNLNRSDQGGSAAVFALVGVVLVIGMVALIYTVKIRGNQARKDQAIAAYEQQESKKTKVNDEPVKVDKSENGIDKHDKSTTPNNDKVNTPSTGRLPDTGPSLVIVQLIGVGFLSMMLSACILSRRHLFRYL